MKALVLLCCLVLIQKATGQNSANQDAAIQRTAQAENAFGFKLLAETRKARPGDNVFQSPVGLALALSAVANGASGQTARDMARTLAMEGVSATEMNIGNHLLLEHLNGLDARIKLEIATGIWTGTEGRIKPEFLLQSKESYRAEATAVEFGNPATARTINDWVNRATHGTIPTIIDSPMPPDTRLMLLNAIYFKAAWEKPFDKKLTQDRPFTLPGGKVASLPRMSLKDKMGYLENTNFQAVILPYVSRQVSLYVFLPKENLERFTEQLSPESWARCLKRFVVRDGTLELPRFKLENTFHLNEELGKMGMGRAFGAQAEFGGISARLLHISDVEQKTFVEVNEEGTEAAAASGIRMRPTFVMRPTEPPFTMVVDHPFYIAIRENSTGAILFHGTIEDPGARGLQIH